MNTLLLLACVVLTQGRLLEKRETYLPVSKITKITAVDPPGFEIAWEHVQANVLGYRVKVWELPTSHTLHYEVQNGHNMVVDNADPPKCYDKLPTAPYELYYILHEINIGTVMSMMFKYSFFMIVLIELNIKTTKSSCKMFFERTFQSQIIHDELNKHLSLKHHSHYHPPKQRTVVEFIKDKAKSYLVLFLETSSIHGLNHLVAPRRHLVEVFLWLSCVCLSVFGSIYLSRTTWTRYQYSPTVVSMDRDMFAWNTTFPCVTICPLNKIDAGKLESYLESSPEPDKERLSDFLYKLANATYQNFRDIPIYDGIDPNSYMDILLNLSRPFRPTLTIGASGISLNIMPTVTEMGLCYAINSKMAVYNSPAYRAKNRWDRMKSYNNTFYVHPLDGEVFAQVINLSTSYDVYIHGPLEVPDISTKHQHSDEDYYMKLYVTALSVYTSPEAAKLSVNQRRCRFFNENNLLHNSVYTYNMCRMECRIRLCLKYCGCIPHFYRRIGDEKICNVTDLFCLSKYEDELYQLIDKTGKKLNCGCFPICDDVNYVIQSNVLQEWFLGTNMQWGIVTYPRMRYRRDIIFGFTDVLVAVGGMAGLFLGCSVLSFMEIVYFLTLRLVCYTHDHIKK